MPDMGKHLSELEGFFDDELKKALSDIDKNASEIAEVSEETAEKIKKQVIKTTNKAVDQAIDQISSHSKEAINRLKTSINNDIKNGDFEHLIINMSDLIKVNNDIKNDKKFTSQFKTSIKNTIDTCVKELNKNGLSVNMDNILSIPKSQLISLRETNEELKRTQELYKNIQDERDKAANKLSNLAIQRRQELEELKKQAKYEDAPILSAKIIEKVRKMSDLSTRRENFPWSNDKMEIFKKDLKDVHEILSDIIKLTTSEFGPAKYAGYSADKFLNSGAMKRIESVLSGEDKFNKNSITDDVKLLLNDISSASNFYPRVYIDYDQFAKLDKEIDSARSEFDKLDARYKEVNECINELRYNQANLNKSLVQFTSSPIVESLSEEEKQIKANVKAVEDLLKEYSKLKSVGKSYEDIVKLNKITITKTKNGAYDFNTAYSKIAQKMGGDISFLKQKDSNIDIYKKFGFDFISSGYIHDQFESIEQIEEILTNVREALQEITPEADAVKKSLQQMSGAGLKSIRDYSSALKQLIAEGKKAEAAVLYSKFINVFPKQKQFKLQMYPDLYDNYDKYLNEGRAKKKANLENSSYLKSNSLKLLIDKLDLAKSAEGQKQRDINIELEYQKRLAEELRDTDLSSIEARTKALEAYNSKLEEARVALSNLRMLDEEFDEALNGGYIERFAKSYNMSDLLESDGPIKMWEKLREGFLGGYQDLYGHEIGADKYRDIIQAIESIDDLSKSTDRTSGILSQLTISDENYNRILEIANIIRNPNVYTPGGTNILMNKLGLDNSKLEDVITLINQAYSETGEIISETQNAAGLIGLTYEQAAKALLDMSENAQATENSLNKLNHTLVDLKGMMHWSKDFFNNFNDHNNTLSFLGDGAYLSDSIEKWHSSGEEDFATTWSANQVSVWEQSIGFTQEEVDFLIEKFYKDVAISEQNKIKLILGRMVSTLPDLYDLKGQFGIDRDIQDYVKALGYDVLHASSTNEYVFFDKNKPQRESDQVYNLMSGKMIDESEAIKIREVKNELREVSKKAQEFLNTILSIDQGWQVNPKIEAANELLQIMVGKLEEAASLEDRFEIGDQRFNNGSSAEIGNIARGFAFTNNNFGTTGTNDLGLIDFNIQAISDYYDFIKKLYQQYYDYAISEQKINAVDLEYLKKRKQEREELNKLVYETEDPTEEQVARLKELEAKEKEFYDTYKEIRILMKNGDYWTTESPVEDWNLRKNSIKDIQVVLKEVSSQFNQIEDAGQNTVNLAKQLYQYMTKFNGCFSKDTIEQIYSLTGLERGSDVASKFFELYNFGTRITENSKTNSDKDIKVGSVIPKWINKEANKSGEVFKTAKEYIVEMMELLGKPIDIKALNELEEIVANNVENVNSSLKETENHLLSIGKEIKGITVYRGTNADTPYSNRADMGGTFWTTSKESAKLHGENLYSSEINMKNALSVDAHGAGPGMILYLGNQADEASKKITELANQMYHYKEILEDTKSSTEELTEAGVKYAEIAKQIHDLSNSNRVNNIPYGYHSSDWFGSFATQNGFDGVEIKNVLYSYDKEENRIMDFYITTQEAQANNIKLLNKENQLVIHLNENYKSMMNNWSHSDMGAALERDANTALQNFINKFDTSKMNDAQKEYIQQRIQDYAKLVEEQYNDLLYRSGSNPSSFFVGGSNFNVEKFNKRKEAEFKSQNGFEEKRQRFIENTEKKLKELIPLEEQLAEIRKNGTEYGEAISSDDPNALEKLKAKLEYLQRIHAEMIAANKEAGRGNEKPYKQYQLQNSNQQIKATEARIKELENKAAKSIENVVTKFLGGEMVENVLKNRLQLLFDEKPNDSMRDKLKSNGFHWSRNEGAWQRQLNDNARYSAKKVLGNLLDVPEIIEGILKPIGAIDGYSAKLVNEFNQITDTDFLNGRTLGELTSIEARIDEIAEELPLTRLGWKDEGWKDFDEILDDIKLQIHDIANSPVPGQLELFDENGNLNNFIEQIHTATVDYDALREKVVQAAMGENGSGIGSNKAISELLGLREYTVGQIMGAAPYALSKNDAGIDHLMNMYKIIQEGSSDSFTDKVATAGKLISYYYEQNGVSAEEAALKVKEFQDAILNNKTYFNQVNENDDTTLRVIDQEAADIMGYYLNSSLNKETRNYVNTFIPADSMIDSYKSQKAEIDNLITEETKEASTVEELYNQYIKLGNAIHALQTVSKLTDKVFGNEINEEAQKYCESLRNIITTIQDLVKGKEYSNITGFFRYDGFTPALSKENFIEQFGQYFTSQQEKVKDSQVYAIPHFNGIEKWPIEEYKAIVDEVLECNLKQINSFEDLWEAYQLFQKVSPLRLAENSETGETIITGETDKKLMNLEDSIRNLVRGYMRVGDVYSKFTKEEFSEKYLDHFNKLREAMKSCEIPAQELIDLMKQIAAAPYGISMSGADLHILPNNLDINSWTGYEQTSWLTSEQKKAEKAKTSGDWFEEATSSLRYINLYEEFIEHGKRLKQVFTDFYDTIKPREYEFRANLTTLLHCLEDVGETNINPVGDQLKKISSESKETKRSLKDLFDLWIEMRKEYWTKGDTSFLTRALDGTQDSPGLSESELKKRLGWYYNGLNDKGTKHAWWNDNASSLSFIDIYEQAKEAGVKLKKAYTELYNKLKPIQEQLRIELQEGLDFTPSDQYLTNINRKKEILSLTIEDLKNKIKEEIESLRAEIETVCDNLIKSPEIKAQGGIDVGVVGTLGDKMREFQALCDKAISTSQFKKIEDAAQEAAQSVSQLNAEEKKSDNNIYLTKKQIVDKLAQSLHIAASEAEKLFNSKFLSGENFNGIYKLNKDDLSSYIEEQKKLKETAQSAKETIDKENESQNKTKSSGSDNTVYLNKAQAVEQLAKALDIAASKAEKLFNAKYNASGTHTGAYKIDQEDLNGYINEQKITQAKEKAEELKNELKQIEQEIASIIQKCSTVSSIAGLDKLLNKADALKTRLNEMSSIVSGSSNSNKFFNGMDSEINKILSNLKTLLRLIETAKYYKTIGVNPSSSNSNGDSYTNAESGTKSATSANENLNKAAHDTASGLNEESTALGEVASEGEEAANAKIDVYDANGNLLQSAEASAKGLKDEATGMDDVRNAAMGVIPEVDELGNVILRAATDEDYKRLIRLARGYYELDEALASGNITASQDTDLDRIVYMYNQLRDNIENGVVAYEDLTRAQRRFMETVESSAWDSYIAKQNQQLVKQAEQLETMAGSGDYGEALTNQFREAAKAIRDVLDSLRDYDLTIVDDGSREKIVDDIVSVKEQASQAFRDGASDVTSTIGSLRQRVSTMMSDAFQTGKISSFRISVQNLHREIEELANQPWINSEEQQDRLRRLSDQINKLYSQANQYNQQKSGGWNVIENITANGDLKKSLESYLQSINAGKISIQSFSSGNQALTATYVDQAGVLQTVKARLNSVTNALEVQTTQGSLAMGFLRSYIRGIGDIFKQVGGMFGTYSVLMRMFSAFKTGTNYLKEYDEALTTISYTMNLTDEQLNNLGESAREMAQDLSISLDDAMSIYEIYANMQTTAQEIEDVGTPTAILSNLSGIDASTAADEIQSVVQAFDNLSTSADDAMHIADVYDYISSQIAVDYSTGIEDMAEAVETVGVVADQAGLTFEQLSAIVGKTAETTRQSGSTIANALKTIMVRTSKASTMSDDVDNDTLSNASKALNAIGIEVYKSNGEYREFDTIMTELASKWDDLTDAQQSNISYQIAATRQTSLFRSILMNWNESMDLATEATEANGNALNNQEKYEESYAGKLQELSNYWQEFWIKLLDSEEFDKLLSIAKKFMDFISNSPKPITALVVALTPLLNMFRNNSLQNLIKTSVVGRPKCKVFTFADEMQKVAQACA